MGMMPSPDEDPYYTGLRSNFARNSQWARPGPYATTLAPGQEQGFQQWIAQNKVPFNANDPVSDYDMRGFYKALMSGDPTARSAIDPNDSRLHYPDKWKTPFHETFSSQSQWAKPDAPYWLDNRYLVTQDGHVLFDDKKPRPREQ